MRKKPAGAILSGCRVLDLTDASGAFCVRLLSEMGAQITRVAPARQKTRFAHLIKTTDILVETSPPGYLDALGFGYPQLKKINPRLILASITPFGQTGPRKAQKASDLTLQALGGWLSVTGNPDRPLPLPGNQAYNTASLFAVNGILLALWDRHATGFGKHLDISILECVAATLDYTLVRYFSDGIVSGRSGSRHWNNAFDVFPCRNGYILLSVHRQWDTLVELMQSENMAEDLMEDKWRVREHRNKEIDHVIGVIEKWTLTHSAKELEELGQLMHFPWAAVKNG